MEKALRGVGIKWMRTVNNYKVGNVVKVLREALTTAEKGLKVIIAEGECMLAKQRRVRAEDAQKIAAGVRVAKPKFGIDEQVCTGDHSCIRLSGCPSLAIKDNPDKLRRDPIATVVESCVGCGLCGEVSHAAILCPSFYRTEVVHNPTLVERMLDRVRRRVIAWLATPEAEPVPALPLHRRLTPRRPNKSNGFIPMSDARPVTVLISALGGEGGGVMTDWILAAAREQNLICQATSVPGVAQRTGATTYYIEVFHQQLEPGKPEPVMALYPQAGDIDLMVATELAEAGRACQNGVVTPDRTVLIASTHRFYLLDEKMGMGDERLDADQLEKAARAMAKRVVLGDFARAAREAGRHCDQCGHAFLALLRAAASCRSRSRLSSARSAAKARRWTRICAATPMG